MFDSLSRAFFLTLARSSILGRLASRYGMRNGGFARRSRRPVLRPNRYGAVCVGRPNARSLRARLARGLQEPVSRTEGGALLAELAGELDEGVAAHDHGVDLHVLLRAVEPSPRRSEQHGPAFRPAPGPPRPSRTTCRSAPRHGPAAVAPAPARGTLRGRPESRRAGGRTADGPRPRTPYPRGPAQPARSAPPSAPHPAARPSAYDARNTDGTGRGRR